ncbi:MULTISPECIES: hypothetical protein [unclassified Mesorhizobium]|uniref:hypothetical protein n=1 Tax=unclassified Mesorhizobium TaxID=325217 RepID=UPI000F74EE48|nr:MULTISPECIES: hypothetical protein [unclassified Mesorhizobium]AZO22475.1 hypothetical protein EJ070_18475 [Mesorhizobium sp. M1E.F.Ca.ET.045.02.1.1]RUW34836.1 hypothetical protein EOA38_09740 [Mesorhizobium sp. M1E.F.Ca.ET.041.01.1.1]RUW85760.1 hypothetical protein EOA29_03405 [Mesorhizobium sp. M1E.F.Ca.ET.063.01.1.1]RWD88760.1 MAG: hypothetical protein EOS38_13595 [Mesorhizobium sp.]RWD92851.1 MAG: hypothetical protein EOS39_14900 [Mesorhizobium sp.]
MADQHLLTRQMIGQGPSAGRLFGLPFRDPAEGLLFACEIAAQIGTRRIDAGGPTDPRSMIPVGKTSRSGARAFHVSNGA